MTNDGDIEMHLKVGQVAARTGISVRTLHHYEEIGLLVPRARSGAGHRLYGPQDVERLLRILALRQLDVSLPEIARCLDRPEGRTLTVIERRLDAVTAEIDAAQRLRRRLEDVLVALRDHQEVDVDVVLQTLEAMTMFEKHFTKQQLETLAERREQLGPEAIAAAEQEWPRLIEAARAELRAGREPDDPRVVPLARRWKELLDMFSGGDEEILRATGQMYRQEPGAMTKMGLDAELLEYMGRAMAML